MKDSNLSTTSIILLLVLFVTGVFSGMIIFDAISQSEQDIPALHSEQNNSLTKVPEPDVTTVNFDTNTVNNTLNKGEHDLWQLNQQASILTDLDALKKRVLQLEEQLNELSNRTVSKSSLSPAPSTGISNIRSFQLYTVARLVRGGIDENLAQQIVRQQNENELKRLELQDTAKRENYYMTERYREELAEIDEQAISLREQIGDDEYDRYLYNSHINNRVKALSVMTGSEAELAGIQDGDIILDYDGKKIFEWHELKAATTEGERGEYVSVNVLRNGELYSFTIPRGPLGIRLGAARVEP